MFKKKLYLPHHNVRGSDLRYESMVYAQAVDDALVQGHCTLDEEDKVIAMAGAAMTLHFGDELGYTVEEIVDQKAHEFVIPEWRMKKSPGDWGRVIFELRNTFVGYSPEDLQETFLTTYQTSPFFGAHWFYASKNDAEGLVPGSISTLPRELLIGFGPEAMLLCDNTHKLLVSFPYANVSKWSAAAGVFSVMLTAPPEAPEPFAFSVTSAQASDMANLIIEINKAIVLAAAKNANPPGVEQTNA